MSGQPLLCSWYSRSSLWSFPNFSYTGFLVPERSRCGCVCVDSGANWPKSRRHSSKRSLIKVVIVEHLQNSSGIGRKYIDLQKVNSIILSKGTEERIIRWDESVRSQLLKQIRSRIHESSISLRFLGIILKSSQTWGFCIQYLCTVDPYYVLYTALLIS